MSALLYVGHSQASVRACLCSPPCAGLRGRPSPYLLSRTVMRAQRETLCKTKLRFRGGGGSRAVVGDLSAAFAGNRARDSV